MARRKKSSLLEDVLTLVIEFIRLSVYFLWKMISLSYDLITVYTSGYRQKSGNAFLKTYFDKGNYGEFILYRLLVGQLGKDAVFTNLYLDNIRTDQTELDVVAVTKSIILLFEMKNYGGSIYGSETDKDWTQVFSRFKKHKFYNPLKQNYAHTKALESYLNVESNIIMPVIVFSNRSKLSKINVGNNHTIIQLNQVKGLLKHIKKTRMEPLNDVHVIREMLVNRSLMPEEVKQRHIEQIKANKENR